MQGSEFEFFEIPDDEELLQQHAILLNVLPQVPTSPATGELPATEEFPGEYDFQMEVGHLGVDIKRTQWQYSLLLKKAFIRAGCGLPLQFKVTPNRPIPQGLYIRAVAVFSDPPDASALPVLRCAIHKQSTADTINRDYQYLDHVVSCRHSSAIYEVDPSSNRHSVRILLSGPQSGSDWETIMFAMMCRGSCDGFNRRPLKLIFTLEKDMQVVGRRALSVRVCAAPKRDCTTEETRHEAEVKAESAEEPQEEEIQNGSFYVPVFGVEDYLKLALNAIELVQRDYPEGPEKSAELQRYNNLIESYKTE